MTSDELQWFYEELFAAVVKAGFEDIPPDEADDFLEWRAQHDGDNTNHPDVTFMMDIAEKHYQDDGDWCFTGFEFDILAICRLLKISPHGSRRKPLSERPCLVFNNDVHALRPWHDAEVIFYGWWKTRHVSVTIRAGRIPTDEEEAAYYATRNEPVPVSVPHQRQRAIQLDHDA